MESDHLVVNLEWEISVKDWAEIRRLRAEGVSISEIARLRGVARNTVKKALASTGPPRYERAPKGSDDDRDTGGREPTAESKEDAHT